MTSSEVANDAFLRILEVFESRWDDMMRQWDNRQLPIFERCSCNGCLLGRAKVPLLHESHITPQGVGGFSFINCTVRDHVKRPFLKCDSCASRGKASEVTGDFHVSNPHGCTTALGGKEDKTVPMGVKIDCASGME